MKLTHLAVAAALSVSAVSASAATTAWGAHDPLEFGGGFVVGSFAALSDIFTFTLSSLSRVTATAVSNESATLDLANAMVTLFSGPVGSGTFVSAFGFNKTSLSSTISPLNPGSYYYAVTGTVGAGAVAGSYALTSQVVVVPEPGTYALMLAGLGAVGWVAARRRTRA